mmetsp:Transcript_48703/g.113696  ORF Transcript_48703/g.113696 Transcript_48703/m.113696 type:complete len:249 (-) Transcript_48703:25-771(-)
MSSDSEDRIVDLEKKPRAKARPAAATRKRSLEAAPENSDFKHVKLEKPKAEVKKMPRKPVPMMAKPVEAPSHEDELAASKESSPAHAPGRGDASPASPSAPWPAGEIPDWQKRTRAVLWHKRCQWTPAPRKWQPWSKRQQQRQQPHQKEYRQPRQPPRQPPSQQPSQQPRQQPHQLPRQQVNRPGVRNFREAVAQATQQSGASEARKMRRWAQDMLELAGQMSARQDASISLMAMARQLLALADSFAE